MMGEEIPWDDLPNPTTAVELIDYFKPVKLSPRAIDNASKIVPPEHWISKGIYTWLQSRANYVFKKLESLDVVEGRCGRMRYIYEFDADGPVLKTVSL